jgi:NADH-quinone oxidoreductase subunit E
MNLSDETLSKIEALIPRYPQKRSAVLPILHLLQKELGYLSNETAAWVAEKLEIQPINVLDVITFYPFFRQKPIGRHLVRICRTLPCALVGAYSTCSALKKAFHCELDEISPDGSVTLEFAECLASCGTGPVVLVDDDLHERVTPEKVPDLVAHIRSLNREPVPTS